MARTTLGGGGKGWTDGEVWTGRYQGFREETFGQGKKARKALVLQFTRDGVDVLERWASAFWERLIAGDKERKIPPQVKPGAVLDVKVLPEQKMKGGKRFRPFTVDLLTGADIPKVLRKS